MPLKSSAVGTTVSSGRLVASARRALAFAAIFADGDARELDDATEDFVACPYVCATYEWIGSKLLRADERLGLSASETRQSVHAGQDSTFHAPIPAGAPVRVEAQVETIRATRAGALMVAGMRIVDDATEVPYTVSRVSVIFRGVAVDGPPAGDAPVEPVWMAPDDGVVRAAMPIVRGFAHVYTECADIWNPIHTERRVALAAGLPDIIVHGSALWALAGHAIVRAHGDGDGRRLRRLACRFSAMVIPGTTVTLEHTQVAGDQTEVRFGMRTENGEAALTQGIAELSVRSPSGA